MILCFSGLLLKDYFPLSMVVVLKLLPFFLLSGRDSFVVNQEFEGLTINDMTDLSCSNWVHHVQYILPQVQLQLIYTITHCYNSYVILLMPSRAFS